MFHLRIVREPQLAEQIEPQQGKNHNPEGQIDLPIQYTPMVGLICNTKEFQCQGQLDEPQYNLYRVEPTSATGQAIEHRREESQQRERQGKGNREGQHGQHRRPHGTRRRLNQHGSDNRSRTGE